MLSTVARAAALVRESWAWSSVDVDGDSEGRIEDKDDLVQISVHYVGGSYIKSTR